MLSTTKVQTKKLIALAVISLVYTLTLNQTISDFVGKTNSSNTGIVRGGNENESVAHPPVRANLLSRSTLSGNTSDASGMDTTSNHTTRTHPCQRICTTRLNKIYYADAPAGLSDRKVILRDLSQLAGFLCAEVIMPPPKEHLSADHNFGKPISDEIEWSDFININFIQDGSPAIKSAKTLEEGMQITSWSNAPAFKLSGPKYKDWLHVVSTEGKVQDDFVEIQKFSFQQPHNATIGFVWEIHKKWYPSDLWLRRLPVLDPEVKESAIHEYRKRMRPFLATYHGLHPKNKKIGCVYTNETSIPPQLAMMQKRLMRRIVRYSPNNTIFGLLHLRRGDAINDCDTSVERMRQYLNCSLNKTELLGRNITMLMTTDEDDSQYRQSIMALIEDYPHVSILDADQIVRTVVKEAAENGIIRKAFENNYYIFEVESILRDWGNTFFKFHLVRRRSTCPDCINLSRVLGRRQ
jgi:hypothetical protein